MREVDAMTVLTHQSTLFRKRASEIGVRAFKEPDVKRMWSLMQEAMSWIQLAENEEALALTGSDAADLAAPFN